MSAIPFEWPYLSRTIAEIDAAGEWPRPHGSTQEGAPSIPDDREDEELQHGRVDR